MSWDATLSCTHCGSTVGEWGYTHNTNRMANAIVLDDMDEPPADSWWWHLNERTAAEGAVFLKVIIDAFDADPDRFRAMNPDNRWGDFDGFRAVLQSMRDCSADAGFRQILRATRDCSVVWGVHG